MKTKISSLVIISVCFFGICNSVSAQHMYDTQHSQLLFPHGDPDWDHVWTGLWANFNIDVYWACNATILVPEQVGPIIGVVAYILEWDDLLIFLLNNHSLSNFKISDTTGHFQVTTGENDCLLIYNYNPVYVFVTYTLLHHSKPSPIHSSPVWVISIILVFTTTLISIYSKKRTKSKIRIG